MTVCVCGHIPYEKKSVTVVWTVPRYGHVSREKKRSARAHATRAQHDGISGKTKSTATQD